MGGRQIVERLTLFIDHCGNEYGVALCPAGRVHVGTAQAGAARTVTLALTASVVDDAYVPMTGRIVSGTGAGQERRLKDYVGATRVATIADSEPNFAPAADATSVIHIIDRPNACYKWHRTCQAKSAYVKDVQPLRYVKQGDALDPATPARPYIQKIKMAPTLMDFEEGLGARSSTEIELRDEPDNDTLLDPYVADRATPAKGTHWRRFFARVLNFSGRQAIIERIEVRDGVWGVPQAERFIIDSMTPQTDKGTVKITLKDPTKQLDQTMTPAPTTGKLALPLLVNDLQATLEAGDGAQYAASGWFRQNDEVIRFSSRVGDVLSWPNGTYRAQLGTEAKPGKAGDVLQQGEVLIDQPFSAVVQRLFNLAGMPDADLDLAQLAAEESDWLHNYRITAGLFDPTENSELVKELLVFAGMSSWWSSIEQKQKFVVYAPRSPSAVIPTLLTDDAHLLKSSVAIERLEDQRITRVTVYFGLSSAVADISQQKNFLTGEQVIDTDAEGPNEYDQVIDRVMNSRFFNADNDSAMNILARRLRARYRNAPENISFDCDPKDLALKEGQVVDLLTSRYTDFAGNPKKIRVFIISKAPQTDRQKYKARVTNFGDNRYGFIAPSGTPNYPNNNGYACVSNSAGLMSDGTEGYLVF